MNDARNAMPASHRTDARWVKSSHSGPTGGNCVEVASLAGGTVAVRDSRHPAGPALVFTAADWAAFVAVTRDGAFG
jgi:hypothetical protein